MRPLRTRTIYPLDGRRQKRRPTDLPLVCRYALTSASWISLASSLHPRMFPALVPHGLWSKERALAATLDTRLFLSEALSLLSPLVDDKSRELD